MKTLCGGICLFLLIGCTTSLRVSESEQAGGVELRHSPASESDPRAGAAQMIELGQIRFTGGDGISTGPVIIEGTDDEFIGIAAEYLYIQSKHGRPGIDWVRVSQGFGCDATMCFDAIEIEMAETGEHRSYTFDISAFRPPEPERPNIDLSVSSDRGDLQFSVSEPVLEITCTRYTDKVWAGRPKQSRRQQ